MRRTLAFATFASKAARPLLSLALVAGCVAEEPAPTPLGIEPAMIVDPFVPSQVEVPPHPRPELVYGFMETGTIELADALLDDCWQPAPYDMVCFDGLLSWTEDPFDEKYWRFVVYALRPLRHLVFAREATGDPAYSDKIVDILWSYVDSGAEDNAFWDKHTAAFRVLMHVNLVGKLRRWGALPPDLEAALDAVLFDNMVFVADPSNFEGNFNHGFNEAVALLVGAENNPQWPESVNWGLTARHRLANLMATIIDPDGVEREQSPYYHLYVMSKAWELHNWADRADVHLEDAISAPIPGMIRYAALIADPAGDVPMVGSSALGNLGTYNPGILDQIELEHPEFAYVRSGGERGVEPTDRFVLFADSGQRVLRTAFGAPGKYADQTHVFFDVGQYRTGHAHYDALQVRVYAGGRTVLPDAGLFTYESGPWHDHFFGTSAHNTVVVDETTQALGTAEPVRAVDGGAWQYQSGRHGLYDGVVHARAVALLDRDVILVLDRLQSDEVHAYDQTWHLPPGSELGEDPADLRITDAQGAPLLRILQADPAPLELRTFSGSTDPLQGWISYSYEAKQRAPVLEYRAKADDAWFATLLLAGAPAQQQAQVTLDREPARDSGTIARVGVTVGSEAWQVEITRLGTLDELLSITPSRPAGTLGTR